MAEDTTPTGTVLEGLLEGDPEAEKLAKLFSQRSPRIVSPTVAGFLNSFGNTKDSSFDSVYKIDGCSVDYVTAIAAFEPEPENDKKSYEILTNITAQVSDFISKVREIRSSYLPKGQSDRNFLRRDTDLESYENAFMRMLGMPSDTDVGDTTERLAYMSPTPLKGKKLKIEIAPLSDFDVEAGAGKYSDILVERNKSITGEKRKFNFNKVCLTDVETLKSLNELISKISILTNPEYKDASNIGSLSGESVLSYHDPGNLSKFYYLKSVPIQDSKIYGCIIEPEKIVLKPFDYNAPAMVNGIKPKTSLLETIIRIRLDRVSGDPGIYPREESDSSSGITIKGSNIGSDHITEVECFLIQKLKKILFLLSEKYTHDTTQIGYNIVKKSVETGTVPNEALTVSELIKKANDAANGVVSQDGVNSSNVGQTEDVDKVEYANKTIEYDENKAPIKVIYNTEILELEKLKAKEDSILFLLKDSSSSSNIGNSNAVYSSISLQEGAIRSASGFDDVLSGPLYSILSYRSKYFDKLLREKKEEIKKKKSEPTSSDTALKGVDGIGSHGLIKNPASDTYSYLGVSPEDFIIYTIAMLAIDQDYLIGLLSDKNKKNLANEISNSIMGGNSKRKDPYGLLERIGKSQEDGGYPTVAQSVNALALIVIRLYEEYISYAEEDDVGFFENLLALEKAQKTKSKDK